MAIPYDPRDAVQCLPEGEYHASLFAVSEETSKAGNSMYVVDWSVVTSTGQAVRVRDWVVVPTFTWKLKRMAQAFGVPQQFADGRFDPGDYIGKPVLLGLAVKDDGSGERNTVSSWSPAPASAAPAPAPMPPNRPAKLDDSDIPF